MSTKSDILEEAVRVGVVENLVSPDFSTDWVESLIKEEIPKWISGDMDVTEDDVQKVDDRITEKLRDMARGIIHQFQDEQNQKTYAKFLED